MARVFEGERTFLHPSCVRSSGSIYRLSGVREEVEQRWTQYAGARAGVQPRQVRLHLPDPAAAGLAAAESAGLRHGACAAGRDDDDAGSGVQHRRQLHDEHELAVVRRRDHDELLRADGGADGPELRLGRGRHRDRDRAGSRLCAAGDEDHRQLLGGLHARDGLRPAAARRSSRRWSSCRRA